MIFNKTASEKYDVANLIEIVDDNNRPLAVLPKDLAHRQLLKHRSVQVLVFNTEQKVYLKKEIKINVLSRTMGHFCTNPPQSRRIDFGCCAPSARHTVTA